MDSKELNDKIYLLGNLDWEVRKKTAQKLPTKAKKAEQFRTIPTRLKLREQVVLMR